MQVRTRDVFYPYLDGKNPKNETASSSVTERHKEKKTKIPSRTGKPKTRALGLEYVHRGNGTDEGGSGGDPGIDSIVGKQSQKTDLSRKRGGRIKNRSARSNVWNEGGKEHASAILRKGQSLKLT